MHGDGHLDDDSVERVVDTAILPVIAAAERCYAAAARAALDKKAAGAMPKTMKYVLWDVLEVPVKRRCAFAWAQERKQVQEETPSTCARAAGGRGYLIFVFLRNWRQPNNQQERDREYSPTISSCYTCIYKYIYMP